MCSLTPPSLSLPPLQHAVPPLRVVLDVLEAVRRPEDAQQSGGTGGAHLAGPGEQRQRPPCESRARAPRGRRGHAAVVRGGSHTQAEPRQGHELVAEIIMEMICGPYCDCDYSL